MKSNITDFLDKVNRREWRGNMIISQFQDKELSLLGFGTMRLPLMEDGTVDEGKVKEMVA